jgi:hypothetical protein
MLFFIAAGLVMAVCFEIFSAKAKFAKEHASLSSFIGLGLFAALAGVDVMVKHDIGAIFEPAVGFFIVYKIQEVRRDNRVAREKAASFSEKVAAGLAARGADQTFEVDVTGVPSGAQWAEINKARKLGLTVESIKDLSTNAVRLRFSGVGKAVE